MEAKGTSVCDESGSHETDIEKYLEKADLKSHEAEKLLEYIKRTYTDSEFKERYWAVKGIHFVNNERLENNFKTFKTELQSSGRKPGSSHSVLVFSNEPKRLVGEICRDGVRTILKKGHVLGHTGSGVHLVHHYDILTRYMIVKQGIVSNFIVVYKAIVGKTKPIVPRMRQDGDVVKPYSGFDCHVSARRVEATMPIEEAYKCSQIYFYEYKNQVLRKFPRQILPYAVIEVEKKYPIHVEIPMLAFGSKVNLWEVKGETRRGFRFVLKSPENKTESQSKQRKQKIEKLKSSLQEQFIEMRTKRPESVNEETNLIVETNEDVVEKWVDSNKITSSVNKQTDEEIKRCTDDSIVRYAENKDTNVLNMEKNKTERTPENDISDGTHTDIPRSMKPVVSLRRLSSNADLKRYTNISETSLCQKTNTTLALSTATVINSKTPSTIPSKRNGTCQLTNNHNDKGYECSNKEQYNLGRTDDLSANKLIREHANSYSELSLTESLCLNKPCIDTQHVIKSFKMLSEHDVRTIYKSKELQRTTETLPLETTDKHGHLTIRTEHNNGLSAEYTSGLQQDQDKNYVHVNKKLGLDKNIFENSCKAENEKDKTESSFKNIVTDKTMKQNVQQDCVIPPTASKRGHQLLIKRPSKQCQITDTSFFKPFLKQKNEAKTHEIQKLNNSKMAKTETSNHITHPIKEVLKCSKSKTNKGDQDINTSMFKAFLPRERPFELSEIENLKGNEVTKNKTRQDVCVNINQVEDHSSVEKSLSPTAADPAPACLNSQPLLAEAKTNEKHIPFTKRDDGSSIFQSSDDNESKENASIVTSTTPFDNDENKQTENVFPSFNCELDIQEPINTESDLLDSMSELSQTDKTIPLISQNQDSTLVNSSHNDKYDLPNKGGASIDESTAKRVKQILQDKFMNLHLTKTSIIKESASISSHLPQSKSLQNQITAPISKDKSYVKDTSMTQSEACSSNEVKVDCSLNCAGINATEPKLQDNLEQIHYVPLVPENNISKHLKAGEQETENTKFTNKTGTLRIKPDPARKENNNQKRKGESETNCKQTPNIKPTNDISMAAISTSQTHLANVKSLSKSQCKSAIIQTLHELSDVLQFLNTTGNVVEKTIDSQKQLNDRQPNTGLACQNDVSSVNKGTETICKKEPIDPELENTRATKEIKLRQMNENNNDLRTDFKDVHKKISVKQELNERMGEKENSNKGKGENSIKDKWETNFGKVASQDNKGSYHDLNNHKTKRQHTHLWRTCEPIHTNYLPLPYVYDIADGPDISELETFGLEISDIKETQSNSTRWFLPLVYDIAEGPDIAKLETFGISTEKEIEKVILKDQPNTKHINQGNDILIPNDGLRTTKKGFVDENSYNDTQSSSIPTLSSQNRIIPVIVSSSKTHHLRSNNVLLNSCHKSNQEDRRDKNTLENVSCMRNILVVPTEETIEIKTTRNNENEKPESLYKSPNEDHDKRIDGDSVNRNDSLNESRFQRKIDTENAHIQKQDSDSKGRESHECPEQADTHSIEKDKTEPKDNDRETISSKSKQTLTNTTSNNSIIPFSEVMKLKFKQFHKYRQGLSFSKFIDYNKIRRDRRRNALRNRNKRLKEKEAKTTGNADNKDGKITDLTKIKLEQTEDSESSKSEKATPNNSVEKAKLIPAKHDICKDSNVSVRNKSGTSRDDATEKSQEKKNRRRNRNRKHKGSKKEAGVGFFLWKNKYGRHFGRNSRRDCDRKRYLKEYDEWTRFQEREALRKKIEAAIGEYRKTYDDKDKNRSDSKVASYLKYLTGKIDSMESKKRQLDDLSEKRDKQFKSQSESSRNRDDIRSIDRKRQTLTTHDKCSKDCINSQRSEILDKAKALENKKDNSPSGKMNELQMTNVETMLHTLIAERFVNLTETLKEQLSRELLAGTQLSPPKSTSASIDNLSTSSQEGYNSLSVRSKSSSNERDISFDRSRDSQKHGIVNSLPYLPQICRNKEDENNQISRDGSYKQVIRQRENQQISMNARSKLRYPSPENNQYDEYNIRRFSIEDEYRNRTYYDRECIDELDHTNKKMYRIENVNNDEYVDRQIKHDIRSNDGFFDGRHEATRKREHSRYCSDNYDINEREINDYYDREHYDRFEDKDVGGRKTCSFYKAKTTYNICNVCDQYIDSCVCSARGYYCSYNQPRSVASLESRQEYLYRSHHHQKERRVQTFSVDPNYGRTSLYENVPSEEYEDKEYRYSHNSGRRRSLDNFQQRYSLSEQNYYRDEKFRENDLHLNSARRISIADDYPIDKYRYDNKDNLDRNNYYKNDNENWRCGVKRSFSYNSKHEHYISSACIEYDRENSNHDVYRCRNREYDQSRISDKRRHQLHLFSKRPRFEHDRFSSENNDYEKTKFGNSKDRSYNRNDCKHSERYYMKTDRHIEQCSISRSKSKSLERRKREANSKDRKDTEKNKSRTTESVKSSKADSDSGKTDNRIIKIINRDSKQAQEETNKTSVRRAISDCNQDRRKRRYYPPGRSTARNEDTTENQLEPGEIAN